MSNPLKSLIESGLKAQAITRGELAIRLGYRNINKALRRVDEFVADPVTGDPIAAKLVEALALPQAAFDEAIRKRHEQLEAWDRAAFRPYLQIRLLKPPSSIMVAALVPGLSHIQLSEGLHELPFDEEIAHVCELYRKHRDRYTPAWPAGEGFRYFRRYGQCLAFDRECRLLVDDPCRPFIVRMRL